MRTISITQDGVWAGQGDLSDEGSIDCMAILGPAGLEHGDGSQQDAAERAYAAIEQAIAEGLDSVEVEGVRYDWRIEQTHAARPVDARRYEAEGIIELVGEEITDWYSEVEEMQGQGWTVERVTDLRGWDPYTALYRATNEWDDEEPDQIFAVEASTWAFGPGWAEESKAEARNVWIPMEFAARLVREHLALAGKPAETIEAFVSGFLADVDGGPVNGPWLREHLARRYPIADDA